MALLVQKFGGTSVANLACLQNAARRVQASYDAGHQVVVVVSAQAGVTDELVQKAQAISNKPNPRELDVLLAAGEQQSVALFAMLLSELGYRAKSYIAQQLPIITDDNHGHARILQIDCKKIRNDLQAGFIVVVAGFQGVDVDGNITTIGRGGSDTSAVALAGELGADECQIYSDVAGIYSADPKIEPKARRLENISFQQMLELANLGAKVLQPQAVSMAGKYRLPLRVLSAFLDGPGTVLDYREPDDATALVSITSCRQANAKVQLSIVGARLSALKLQTAINNALAAKNVDIQQFHQSETKVSIQIAEKDLEVAVQTLHRSFILQQEISKEIPLKD